MMRTLILLFLFSINLAHAETREWRNDSGTKRFQATYVSNDGKQVTLRNSKGRFLTFAIDKLHSDDQKWLRENHPPQTSKQGEGPAQPAPKGAAFDTLKFGDSHHDVIDKLSKSRMVESSVPEVMLARVGLNGTFKTKQTIGGLHCHLYFDWDSNMKLKEVTLRTKPKDLDSYSGKLQANWAELIQLLTILHGDSVQGAPYPDSADLQDGLVLNSHLWRTEDGHSVLLGTGQEGAAYSVVVRITSDRIEANPVE